MKLSKEYIAEQEDCIKRNFDTHVSWGNNPTERERYMTLRNFCAGSKTILSVGCGGVEPVAILATHAVDVHPVAKELLKSQAWPGKFFIASCDELPFKHKELDAAVCSEVIEHLPDTLAVQKTFWELDRVAKKWIVTTPNIDVLEPTHKFIFSKEDLLKLTEGLNAKIERKGIFWYISKT